MVFIFQRFEDIRQCLCPIIRGVVLMLKVILEKLDSNVLFERPHLHGFHFFGRGLKIVPSENYSQEL